MSKFWNVCVMHFDTSFFHNFNSIANNFFESCQSDKACTFFKTSFHVNVLSFRSADSRSTCPNARGPSRPSRDPTQRPAWRWSEWPARWIIGQCHWRNGVRVIILTLLQWHLDDLSCSSKNIHNSLISIVRKLTLTNHFLYEIVINPIKKSKCLNKCLNFLLLKIFFIFKWSVINVFESSLVTKASSKIQWNCNIVK